MLQGRLNYDSVFWNGLMTLGYFTCQVHYHTGAIWRQCNKEVIPMDSNRLSWLKPWLCYLKMLQNWTAYLMSFSFSFLTCRTEITIASQRDPGLLCSFFYTTLKYLLRKLTEIGKVIWIMNHYMRKNFFHHQNNE